MNLTVGALQTNDGWVELDLDTLLSSQGVLSQCVTVDVIVEDTERYLVTTIFANASWQRYFHRDDAQSFVNLVRQLNPKVKVSNEIDMLDPTFANRLLFARFLVNTNQISG